MTVFYNSKNHIRLLFGRKGSTLHEEILKSSLFGAWAAVVFLLKYYDIKDLSLDKDQGFTFFSKVSAFLVVWRFTKAYERMW